MALCQEKAGRYRWVKTPRLPGTLLSANSTNSEHLENKNKFSLGSETHPRCWSCSVHPPSGLLGGLPPLHRTRISERTYQAFANHKPTPSILSVALSVTGQGPGVLPDPRYLGLKVGGSTTLTPCPQILCLSGEIMLIFRFFFPLIRTQRLVLVAQVPYHLSTSPNPFCFTL
jgi:hypothetical protein